MILTRYEPWTMVNRFQDEMNKAFSRSFANEEEGTEFAATNWVPAVDIREQKNQFVIHADVPGLLAKDIHISMDQNTLTIQGERADEKEEEKQGYRRVERACGHFSRRFSLPDTADEEQIAASYKNGVLEILIPKKELAKARRITVQ